MNARSLSKNYRALGVCPLTNESRAWVEIHLTIFYMNCDNIFLYTGKDIVSLFNVCSISVGSAGIPPPFGIPLPGIPPVWGCKAMGFPPMVYE